MLLAGAVVLRADTSRRITELDQQVRRNARSQNGEEPAKDPISLPLLFGGPAAGLLTLVTPIDRTNDATRFDPSPTAAPPGGATVPSDPTLTDTFAARDALRLRVEGYRRFAVAATVDTRRYWWSTIRIVSYLSMESVQCQANRLSAAHRTPDTAIPAGRWTTLLVQ